MSEWWGELSPDGWPSSPVQRWIDARGFARPTRVQADAARLWIVRELGALRLDEVTSGVVDRFAVVLRAALSTRSCRIYLTWLKHAFALALDAGVIDRVPRISMPADTDRKPRMWLTPEQTAELYAELERRATIPGMVEGNTVLAVRMQETLVLRPGEVLHRRWEDLRVDRGWTEATLQIRPVALPDGTYWRPKRTRASNGERALSVPPVLLGVLREHWLRAGQPRTGWIFPGVGGKPQQSFKTALANACEALGLPILTPHGLRHTGATRLAIGGVERRTLMAIGGWVTPETLDAVYLHTTDARVAAVLASTEVPLGVPQRVPQQNGSVPLPGVSHTPKRGVS